MIEEKLLFSRRNCPHCGGARIIVRSRDGGFVTQNCMKNCDRKGGRPSLVTPADLPVRQCSTCGVDMSVWLIGNNYAYKCPQCDRTLMVHELVHPWQKYFREDGVAIPGVDFDRLT